MYFNWAGLCPDTGVILTLNPFYALRLQGAVQEQNLSRCVSREEHWCWWPFFFNALFGCAPLDCPLSTVCLESAVFLLLC